MRRRWRPLRQPCRWSLFGVGIALAGALGGAVLAAGAGPAAGARTRPAGVLEIDAWTFDRGNAEILPNPDPYADYRDRFPDLVVAGGVEAGAPGGARWEVEYDIDFPVDAAYTLRVRYGAPDPRPVEVWLDSTRVGEACGRVTGNPPPYPDRHPRHERPRRAAGFHGQEWEAAAELRVAAGRHTLRLERRGRAPRLSALRLESDAPFAKGWKAPEREVRLERVSPRERRIFLPPDAVNPAALRAAIESWIETFGPDYPRGAEHLRRLGDLVARRRALPAGAGPEGEKLEHALRSLQREALLAHPALRFDRLLFVERVDRRVSIYTGHLRRDAPGGNLCVLSPVAPGGEVTELVPELEGGVFGRFDLSFDARRIVFSYAPAGGRYRIYEIDVDPATGRRAAGASLRRLTRDSAREEETIRAYAGSSYGNGYDDIDPCYLPGGKIMFASTRPEHAVLCAPVTATTLHVMDADGGNIRCISSGQVNELSPSLLRDGRVVYTRWEYVDKGFGNAQSLWSVYPDGSGSDHVYKNDVIRPASMVWTRGIPGSRRIVTIGAGHHGGLAGPVVLIDTCVDRRSPARMTNLTPEVSYPGLYPMKSTGGVFREPFPFSESFFLVSHDPGCGSEPARFGLYVLDRWGNRAELFRDPELSCFQPVAFRPRGEPHEIPPLANRRAVVAEGDEEADPGWREPENGELATLFLQDVYQGLEGIERGRVRYLRVMEAMNLSWHDAWRSGRQGDAGPGMQASAVSYGADVAVKKIHGIARVHPDGSACFRVPAGKNLYFQVLDESYMELQRMRTFINLMPGEKRSCIGCHEVRRKAPAARRPMAEALREPPQALRPQPGDRGARTVHFARDVQPIFDRHCVRCHGGPEPEGGLDLSGELTRLFSRSYESLFQKDLVSYLQGGFGSANLPAELPMTFGSHQSRLVERIRCEPCGGGLDREERIRIVTWIDANAPYYGTHRGKKNLKWKDEPDFRPVPESGE